MELSLTDSQKGLHVPSILNQTFPMFLKSAVFLQVLKTMFVGKIEKIGKEIFIFIIFRSQS